MSSTSNTTSNITPDEAYDSVKNYYGKVLTETKDLLTSACTSASKPHAQILKIMKSIPQEILSKFYGCGNTIPLGIQDLNVLDLGSGSGRDCYICASLVGSKGKVYGIDITDEQLEVANKFVEPYTKGVLGYSEPNLFFRKGYMEFIEESANIEKSSIDIVISNCVVNLSPEKENVIQGVYNVLKHGGEFFFSDVFCDRRLAPELMKDEILFGECISGALYINDFLSMCKKIGFVDARAYSQSEIKINDPRMKSLLGNARFYSITFRLFKIHSLEQFSEDYGHVVVYKNAIEGYEHNYKLDDTHTFETNKPYLVSGNTAAILEESYLSKYFQVTGNRDTHYGEFQSTSSGATLSAATTSEKESGSSSCCK